MKKFIIIFLGSLVALSLTAQRPIKSDQNSIKTNRKLSNLAFKKHNVEDIKKYLTDDVYIYTSAENVISGKMNYAKIIKESFDTNKDKYFVRKTSKVRISKDEMKAWEKGNWIALRPKTKNWESYGGDYAAMWVKIDNEWKIKSQLFVKLF